MKNETYSPSTLLLMQSLMATLADIDFAHDCEVDRIEASSADPSLKSRLRAQLAARHRERREPYVQQLAAFEARIAANMPDVRHGPGDRDAA
jgi:hypothetical protein